MVFVTDHAIKRYQERVERCSVQDAEDRLAHAYEISKPANKALAYKIQSRCRYPNEHAEIRYCPVESLALVCLPDGKGGCGILTVMSTKSRGGK